MKLVFTQTRGGSYIANNSVTTYTIEERNDKYTVDSPFFYIKDKFDTLSEAEKYCQEIENEVFDRNAINTAFKKAIETLGGIEKFYNFIADKTTKIVLREDCDTFINIKSDIIIWSFSNDLMRRFSYEVLTHKFSMIKGCDIGELISKEFLYKEVYLFPKEDSEKSDEN